MCPRAWVSTRWTSPAPAAWALGFERVSSWRYTGPSVSSARASPAARGRRVHDRAHGRTSLPRSCTSCGDSPLGTLARAHGPIGLPRSPPPFPAPLGLHPPDPRLPPDQAQVGASPRGARRTLSGSRSVGTTPRSSPKDDNTLSVLGANALGIVEATGTGSHRLKADDLPHGDEPHSLSRASAIAPHARSGSTRLTGGQPSLSAAPAITWNTNGTSPTTGNGARHIQPRVPRPRPHFFSPLDTHRQGLRAGRHAWPWSRAIYVAAAGSHRQALRAWRHA